MSKAKITESTDEKVTSIIPEPSAVEPKHHSDFNRVRCIHDPYTMRYALQECDADGNWNNLPCQQFKAIKDALEFFQIVKRIKSEIPADIGRWSD